MPIPTRTASSARWRSCTPRSTPTATGGSPAWKSWPSSRPCRPKGKKSPCLPRPRPRRRTPTLAPTAATAGSPEGLECVGERNRTLPPSNRPAMVPKATGASLKVSGASGARFHDAGTNLAGYIPDGAQGEAPKVSGASGARFDYAAAQPGRLYPRWRPRRGPEGVGCVRSSVRPCRYQPGRRREPGGVGCRRVLNGRAAVAVTGMTSTAGASSPRHSDRLP